VIYSGSLGVLKTVSVSGVVPNAGDRPDGLEFGKLNLQEYFINLMNEEVR